MLKSVARISALRPLTSTCIILRSSTNLYLAQLRPLRLAFTKRQLTERSSVLVRASTGDQVAATVVPEFSSLGLSADLLTALEEKGLTQPTEIQAAAVPALVRDRKNDFLLASHTGSGKTLAYLLPIVHILKEQELLDGPPVKPRRPRALILGPTRELTDQILGVAKSISHIAKFRSTVINGGGDMSTQKAALSRPIDVLVGTPSRVVQHAEKSNLFYGDVDFVVLDEADTMLDRGFGIEVREILKAVRHKAQPARCVLVSATMTAPIRKLLAEEFPSMRTIETSSLHKGVAGARHIFLPIPGDSDKLDVLLQVVEGEHFKGKRVMIFCNTLDSCRAVDHHLRERTLPTACYHGDVPLDDRRRAIKEFSSAGNIDNQEQLPPLLVCTDLAARGLDIPGQVDHIVNFDFPLNPVDYLHRTGRTARAGASGKITSLVGKPDQVLATRIEEALGKGLPLDALSSDRAVLPAHMRPKPETLKQRAYERKGQKLQKKGVRGGSRLNDTSTSSNSTGRLSYGKKTSTSNSSFGGSGRSSNFNRNGSSSSSNSSSSSRGGWGGGGDSRNTNKASGSSSNYNRSGASKSRSFNRSK